MANRSQAGPRGIFVEICLMALVIWQFMIMYELGEIVELMRRGGSR